MPRVAPVFGGKRTGQTQTRQTTAELQEREETVLRPQRAGARLASSARDVGGRYRGAGAGRVSRLMRRYSAAALDGAVWNRKAVEGLGGIEEDVI